MRMIKNLKAKLGNLAFWKKGKENMDHSAIDYRDISQREHDVKQIALSTSLEENLKTFDEITGYSYDMNQIRFTVGENEIPAAVLYVDGMVDSQAVENLLKVLKIDIFKPLQLGHVTKKEIFEVVKVKILNSSEIKEADNMDLLFDAISHGETAVLFDGTDKALLCETRGFESRSITEPEGEVVIRGPRDGFVENLRTNTSLLRRRIHTPNLWIESIVVGSLTRTEVAFSYIKGLIGEEVLEELRSRLERIDTDSILGAGTVEEFIEDMPYSPISTIFRTERPDRVTNAVLEGRAAIFIDGTPFVLIVPAGFAMDLHAPDDYFEVFPVGSFIRALRFVSFVASIFLPGFYVAVLNFHPELLPTALLLRIQATREGVPFPVVVEILMMEAAFEVLREAGLRLPKAIGSAISIVGALILGDAAIRAGIVSPGVVIIVAFTAIASFTTPSFGLALGARLLRFAVILLGSIMGLLGIQFGFIALVIHMVSLRSFGYPYFAPFGPFIWSDMKDSIFRSFWWAQDYRPSLLGFREPRRQRPGQRPRPRKLVDRGRTGRKEE